VHDVRREHFQEVEARHIGQVRAHEPDIRAKSSRHADGRPAVAAEVQADLTGPSRFHKIGVAVAGRIDDHDFVDPERPQRRNRVVTLSDAGRHRPGCDFMLV
jgi:hypothetical protein